MRGMFQSLSTASKRLAASACSACSPFEAWLTSKSHSRAIVLTTLRITSMSSTTNKRFIHVLPKAANCLPARSDAGRADPGRQMTAITAKPRSWLEGCPQSGMLCAFPFRAVPWCSV